ncbi:MAG: hypothetical protein GY830_04860 [Bacteroidetes bacterium]|nr:hypothetical protein [Bacteroidota bacterium]
MLVKCIENDIYKLSDKNLKDFYSSWSDLKEIIKINSVFIVWGIEFSSVQFIYLNEKREIHCPFAYPLEFFKIIDPRMSKHFIYGDSKVLIKNKIKTVPFISFKEWALDNIFHENLFDWNKKEKSIFKKYYELMQYEYYNPNLNPSSEKLEIAEGNWAMCPKCIDAWEIDTINEMVKCPKCETVYVSPYSKHLEFIKKEDLLNINYDIYNGPTIKRL